MLFPTSNLKNQSTNRKSGASATEEQVTTSASRPSEETQSSNTDKLLLQQSLFVTPSVNKTTSKMESSHNVSVFQSTNNNMESLVKNDDSGDFSISNVDQDPTPLSKLYPSHAQKRGITRVVGTNQTLKPAAASTSTTRTNIKSTAANSKFRGKGLLDIGKLQNRTKDNFSINESFIDIQDEIKRTDHTNESVLEENENLENSLEETSDEIDYLYKMITHEIEQGNYETAEFLGEMMYVESHQMLSNVTNADKMNNRITTINKKKMQLALGYRGIYLYCYALFMNRKYLLLMEVSKKYLDSQTAYSFSSSSSNYHLCGIAFLFGKCCLLLERNVRHGIKYITDFEKTIWGIEEGNREGTETAVFKSVGYPTSATICCLLGKMYKKLDLTKQSAYYHCKALENNFHLWESIQDLCDMGVEFDLKTVFNNRLNEKYTAELDLSRKHNKSEKQTNQKKSTSTNTVPFGGSSVSPSSIANLMTKKRPSEINVENSHGIKKSKVKTKKSNSKVQASALLSAAGPVPYGLEFKQSPLLLGSLNTQTPSKVQNISNTQKTSPDGDSILRNTPPRQSNQTDSIFASPFLEANKSPRLFDLSTRAHSYQALHIEKNNKAMNKTISANGVLNDDIWRLKNNHCDTILYLLFKSFQVGSKYDIYKAIRILNDNNDSANDVPSYYLKGMPWCLKHLGFLHFEATNYKMSLMYFEKLRALQRCNLDKMDMFSTLLWHLKDKRKLSELSHDLLSIEPLSNITWFCIGNLFSLMENHEDAIKSFQKSVSLNKYYEYGYTLLGHEYLNIECFDLSKKCYKKSISLNPLHYNSYYGLGMCLFKIGQYKEALFYFNKAQSINRGNPVLVLCCGLAMEKMNLKAEALKYYNTATLLKPDSTLAIFKKGSLLMDMQFYTEALKTFEELKKMQPNEPTVHYLLGKLYKIMGRKQDSIKELTVAMSLDPKGSQMVKEIMQD